MNDEVAQAVEDYRRDVLRRTWFEPLPWLDDDPPTWAWPWGCHRYGHIYVLGDERCRECGEPYWVAYA